ncbi:MAG: M28 family peptidase [Bacteroidales bacterium]|nr:M28 family peptidase [Bacteroidales bacterium]
MKNPFALLVVLLLMALSATNVAAQNERYEAIVTESLQRGIVDRLCDSVMEGRASGSKGCALAREYIQERFKSLELKPFYYNSLQSFRYNDTIKMHNIMGVVPALGVSDKYIIVSAHYDHIGIIKGKTYPGADDNASGVAAMLTVAEMFSQMRRDSVGPGVNILFVAFDGKEFSMSGSKYFTSHLNLPPENIICDINIDILGATLVPVHKRLDYLIVLGRNTLPERLRDCIAYANRGRKALDIDYTFYGSDDFTRTMYRLGDHYPFYQSGIPALLFTSGFHQHTLKTTDTPDIIDYPVLARRTKLIFNTIINLSNGGNR